MSIISLVIIVWGGKRTSVEAMRLWFRRKFRLFPNLQFEIHSMAVSGYPWNTNVVVEWTDRATPADGKNYVNSGVHVVQLRWGKVVSIHANGIEEAKSPPIIG